MRELYDRQLINVAYCRGVQVSYCGARVLKLLYRGVPMSCWSAKSSMDSGLRADFFPTSSVCILGSILTNDRLESHPLCEDVTIL